MGWLEPLRNLIDRLQAYSPWQVAVELVIIWILVYAVVRFVQGTRAAGALKGMLVLLVVLLVLARVLGGDGGQAFQRIAYLYDRIAAIVLLGLVVVFQPELRRALVRVGEASFFRSSPGEVGRVIDAIVSATRFLSKQQFGAIIAVERQSGLSHLAEEGTSIGAAVSAELLQTIFYPGTALHDLAVVVRGSVVTAAGVQLPLAEPQDMPSPTFGARHRAAVGLTKECDALVVVVSEETGSVRLAERGVLSQPLDPEELRAMLRARLSAQSVRRARTVAEEVQAQQTLDAASQLDASTLPDGAPEIEADQPKTIADETTDQGAGRTSKDSAA